MLDPDSADVIEMLYVVLSCKVARCDAQLSRLDILARSIVIESDDYFFFVKDLVKSGFFEDADGHRCGDIIAEHYVEFCLDQVTSVDFRKSGVSCEDLLCHCHAHGLVLLMLLLP